MFSSFGMNSIHEYFVLIFSSTMNQFAILSDIHANIWALEAVLDNISRRGPAQLINLGDSLYGPLEPQATAACLMQLPIVSILGNQDRILLEKPVPPVSPSLAYVLNDLAPSSLDWLAAQPYTRLVARELFLCHGTPNSDQTYLLESMTPSGGFSAGTNFHPGAAWLAGATGCPVRPQPHPPHPTVARWPARYQSGQRWAAGLFGLPAGGSQDGNWQPARPLCPGFQNRGGLDCGTDRRSL